MMQGLIEHIRRESARNVPLQRIEAQLVAGGWPPEEIKKAFAEVQKSGSVFHANNISYFIPTEKKHHHIIRKIFVLLLFTFFGFLIAAYIAGGY